MVGFAIKWYLPKVTYPLYWCRSVVDHSRLYSVEEQKFKDREGSLVVCHRKESKEQSSKRTREIE
jgi:hypothetical protein